MKKQLLIICSILLLVCGCNKVKRSSELDLNSKIGLAEETNIQTDLELYLTLSEAAAQQMQFLSEDESLNSEEKNKQINLTYLKFMADMDSFLAVRVSDDLASLASSSELYMVYIALIQTYCETYQSEVEELMDTFDFADPESSKNPAVQALSFVESFYLGLIEE